MPVSSGSGSGSAAPSAIDVPSAPTAPVATSVPPGWSARTSGVQRPILITRRTPWPCSSRSTAAALGAPIPDAWTVSSAPVSVWPL